jgi:hypothetical protein
VLDGLVRDPGGNTYFAWQDQRSGMPDVFAQALDAGGAPQWLAGGVQVCGAVGGQYSASIAPVKSAAPARVYMAWTDNRLASSRTIFLQRLDAYGTSQWLGDGVTRVAVEFATVDAAPDHVRLTWRSPETVFADVERAPVAGVWSRIGTATTDGTGRLVFEDRDVAAGSRYGYRLVALDAERTVLTTEVWVDVPSALALALEGARPDPSPGPLTVALTLPSDASASLELVDVAGRRVLARELGSLGPGRHTVRLDDRLAPGLYFLVLRQSGRAVTTRAAVLR